MDHLEAEPWPSLSGPEWPSTRCRLRSYAALIGQIGGQTQLDRSAPRGRPAPLYVDAAGLTTSLIPHRPTPFTLQLDMSTCHVVVRTLDGRVAHLALAGQPSAVLEADLVEAFRELHISTHRALETAAHADVLGPSAYRSEPRPETFDPRHAATFAVVLHLLQEAFKGVQGRVGDADGRVCFLAEEFELLYTQRFRRDARHEDANPTRRRGGVFRLRYVASEGTEGVLRASSSSGMAGSGTASVPYAKVRDRPDPVSAILELADTCLSPAQDGAL